MTWNPYPPLPLGAVRDLLGLTRGLYRATLADEPRDISRLESLEKVGKTLRAVLGAARAYPGTNDHLDAWAAAERATRELAAAAGASLAPLVAATARRIRRPGSMA